ncbi:MAG: hypothetical protein K1X95_03225 [Acidimicrobiia bacterium]|nr:hypothetical protein [Acidimicrobiia bacterium]
MAVMVACALLLLTGLAAGIRWGGRPFTPPEPVADLTVAEAARRYVWYAAIALVAGMSAGILVVGAGGRLVMRLLAVTAGPDAQGLVTEAEEVVGRVSVDGTIGFVLFNGMFFGIPAAVLFLVVRRFLPAGRVGGVVFGAGLLVVFGTTLDPLRRDNPDFDIVGPGWVAVLAFGAVAIVFGLAVEGTTCRLSSWLPLLTSSLRDLVHYGVAVPPAFVALPVTLALLLVGAVTVLATRWRALVAVVRSHGWVVAGRVLTVGVVVAAGLTGAIAGVVDIAAR